MRALICLVLLLLAGPVLAQGTAPTIPPHMQEFERQRRENDERYRRADREFQQREAERLRLEDATRRSRIEAERQQLYNDRLEQQLRQPGAPVYVLPQQPAPSLGCRGYQPAYDQYGRLLGQICIP